MQAGKPSALSIFSFISAHFFANRYGSSIVQQNVEMLQSSSPGITPSRPFFLSAAFCSASESRLPPRSSEQLAAASGSDFDAVTVIGSFSPSSNKNLAASITDAQSSFARPGTGGLITFGTAFGSLPGAASARWASFFAASAPALSPLLQAERPSATTRIATVVRIAADPNTLAGRSAWAQSASPTRP